MNEAVKATITIQNTGRLAGKEIPQIYVSYPSSANEPPHQLKGFNSTMLQPGESSSVFINFRQRDLSIWDVHSHSWSAVKGTFTFAVGSSSTDIRASTTLTM